MRWPPRQSALGRRNVLFVRRWALWSQRPRFIAYCLLIELAAIGVTVVTVATSARTVHWQDVGILTALIVAGMLQAEFARQTERTRRRVSSTQHINMTSVWTFAGTLLLPSVFIPALIVVLYTHLALRSWYRLRQASPFRTVFNASSVTLTCLIAHAVPVAFGHQRIAADTPNLSLVIVVTAVTYFVVGALIVIPVLNRQSRSAREVFGSLSDNALELTTIGLGAVTAVLLVTSPLLVVVLVPTMLLIERSVLVRQLEIDATTDSKTGVYNAAFWHHIADLELARSSRAQRASIGLLMIDIDHFKRVNDSFGHLAGDAVLKSVATTITREVRGCDSVGRFGGEEFVVLLPGIKQSDAHAAAERIRVAIGASSVTVNHGGDPVTIDGLTVSIGVAMYPDAGEVLDIVLHAVDTALYLAKDGGRNRVEAFAARLVNDIRPGSAATMPATVVTRATSSPVHTPSESSTPYSKFGG